MPMALYLSHRRGFVWSLPDVVLGSSNEHTLHSPSRYVGSWLAGHDFADELTQSQRLPLGELGTMSPSLRFPKLVAFDLDYTLWDLWIDTHISGPLHRHQDTLNEVLDRYNDKICFYKEVPEIMHRLKAEGVVIAACSRTHAPALARQALSLLLVPPPGASRAGQSDDSSNVQPAIKFFDQLEIYPGSKLTHFRKLHEKTGLPYSEMLFFDDEHRNQEVEKLGVTFCLVPEGVNNKVFEKGLARWRVAHSEGLEDEA
ncbi:HAD superfamily protein [Pleurotus pulmonarius]